LEVIPKKNVMAEGEKKEDRKKPLYPELSLISCGT
jgi:hypothetical protein